MFIAGVAKPVPAVEGTFAQRLFAYWQLTKPRVAALVLVVAVAGFWVAAPGFPDRTRLAGTIVGVALLAAGIFALNQYLEREWDAIMRRTRNRPLPSNRVAPAHAAWFGWLLSVGGLVCLAWVVNWLSAFIGLFTFVSYLFVYTPLKRRTPLCTLWGAFPGATPPLLGWAAARGHLSIEAWWLFAILFLWQFPHFHSIALLYREDYARAGFRLWTVVEPEGTTVGRQIIWFTVLLLGVSMAPFLFRDVSPLYVYGAGALGCALLYLGIRAASDRSKWEAQRLLLGSVIYLPGLLLLMVLNM